MEAKKEEAQGARHKIQGTKRKAKDKGNSASGLSELTARREGKRKIKAKSIALETPALLNNPYDPGKQMDCAIS